MTHPADEQIEAAAKAVRQAHRACHSGYATDREVARAAITAYEASKGDGWQPIETAPMNGTWILVHAAFEDGSPDGSPQVVQWKYDPRGFTWKPYEGSALHERIVKAWRPLPSPPPETDG